MVGKHFSQLISSDEKPGELVGKARLKKWKVMPETPVISIVDDDESVREAIESLMKSVGYVAKVFPSAGDFLSSGKVADTDCLILDVQMPGMSGLELQNRLAASESRVPIIFISAHCDAEARARALEAGAVGFLQKPFGEDALLKAIDSSLAIQMGSRQDQPDPD
jgi:FixJ family two-component response regulator